MIVICRQNNTMISNDADSACGDVVRLYGEKLGKQAYVAVKSDRI